MEPMALGSPTSPPSPGGASQFLPPFLLGESTPTSMIIQPGTISPSPTKASKHVSFDITPTVFEIKQTTPVKSPYLSGRHLFSGHTPTEKARPPVVDLFDSFESANTARQSTHDDTMEVFSQMSAPLIVNLPTPTDSYQSDYGVTNNTWVTVFGFPLTAVPHIISHFGECGTIMEKRTPQRGNWIHIRYQSKLECRKALSKNGRILGDIMIGVISCMDKEILNELRNKENIPVTSVTPDKRARLLSSPYRTPVRPISVARPNGSSPFSQSYRIAHADTEVLSPVNVPRRSSTGVFSKAMEYIFDW